MGKPGPEEQQGVTRLALPVRTKEDQEADSDSEAETEDMSSLVAGLRRLHERAGPGSLGDYLSLPEDMKVMIMMMIMVMMMVMIMIIMMMIMKEVTLSCSLESGVDQSQLYLNTEGDLVSRTANKGRGKQEDFSGAALAEHKPHIGKKKMKKLKREEREKTKGKDWYDMPALEMTEERQRDLELLQMRSVLDPKRFYKKNTSEALPKYFRIGTIQDNAADFYTDRVSKKDRKQTMVDELLADAEFKKYQKRKYVEIIEDKAKKQGKYVVKKSKKAS